jgi:hypothetical protein
MVRALSEATKWRARARCSWNGEERELFLRFQHAWEFICCKL